MATTITTIRGLQNLPNLESFYADWNSLQTVDLSGLTNLLFVDISDCNIPGTGTNSLTSVNLTGCTAIEELRLDDSDFSANSLSSIIGLSNLTNLHFIDLDQCELSGTANLSALSSLADIDVNGNENLTEVIITGSQPINNFNASSCNLTQESIDNILVALSENSESTGYVQLSGVVMGIPSNEVGVPAIRILDGRGWDFNINDYARNFIATSAYPSQSSVCTDIGNSVFGYAVNVYSGSMVESGSIVYTDGLLTTVQSDGWFGTSGSNIAYLVSGSGLVVSQSTCV